MPKYDLYDNVQSIGMRRNRGKEAGFSAVKVIKNHAQTAGGWGGELCATGHRAGFPFGTVERDCVVKANFKLVLLPLPLEQKDYTSVLPCPVAS